MAYSGRNELCLCGSGKKYKKCCLEAEDMQMPTESFKKLIDEFRAATGGKVFSSLDEAQFELEHITLKKNTTPLSEFCGLSPEHMSQFLYRPFDSGLISFNLNITEFQDSPFLRLFNFLVSALSQGELKATVTGNLPRNFCREAARAYYGEDTYKEREKRFHIMSEVDFEELQPVRIVAEMAGFVKKSKGKYRLTNKGKLVTDKRLEGKHFIELFKAYTSQFNWGYRDRYPELGIIQSAFMFTLFTLKKYGNVYRPPSFYEELFVKAFPMALNEVTENSYWKPEEEVKRCYSLRALEWFAHFMGFAEFDVKEGIYYLKKYELKKTSLLDNWVHFNL